MGFSFSIPSEYATLIGALRCAVKGVPPDADPAAADWPKVLKQARQQGVDTFLYPSGTLSNTTHVTTPTRVTSPIITPRIPGLSNFIGRSPPTPTKTC
jgi:hypothetical protein